MPVAGANAFCDACGLNQTIPDLGVLQNLQRWQRLEAAKHRLVYGLLRLRLPLVGRDEDPRIELGFDFLAGPGRGSGQAEEIVTGHARGLITIDIAEADDAELERHRQDMAEPFRTLFGDERSDYSAALRTHYAAGPPPNWQERFVSRYASTHPWEDFAETWAHYLHIVDAIETAYAFGLAVHPKAGRDAALSVCVDFDPYPQSDFDALVKGWCR